MPLQLVRMRQICARAGGGRPYGTAFAISAIRSAICSAARVKTLAPTRSRLSIVRASGVFVARRGWAWPLPIFTTMVEQALLRTLSDMRGE